MRTSQCAGVTSTSVGEANSIQSPRTNLLGLLGLGAAERLASCTLGRAAPREQEPGSQARAAEPPGLGWPRVGGGGARRTPDRHPRPPPASASTCTLDPDSEPVTDCPQGSVVLQRPTAASATRAPKPGLHHLHWWYQEGNEALTTQSSEPLLLSA